MIGSDLRLRLCTASVCGDAQCCHPCLCVCVLVGASATEILLTSQRLDLTQPSADFGLKLASGLWSDATETGEISSTDDAME